MEKAKGNIDFIMFELKGKSTLDTLTAEYQALTGEPATLALANPACGVIVGGTGCDVIRRRDIQIGLVYLTSEISKVEWENL